MLLSYLFSVLGGIICVANLNTIIVPLKLYNGGFIGITRAFSDLAISALHLNIPQTFNLVGMMMLVLNIPLLLLAYYEISRTFFLKTVLTVVSQSMVMTITPVPSIPIIDDYLTTCIIDRLIVGFGVGLTLRSGGSGGETDIIGVYCTKKFPDVSASKLGTSVSSIAFLYRLFRSDVEVVVYSAIFPTATSLMVGRTHYQNVKSSVMISTRHPEVIDTIVQFLHRDITRWQGCGAYTYEQSYIFMTVASELEIDRAKRAVRDIDLRAFIIINDQLDISGNFVKRL